MENGKFTMFPPVNWDGFSPEIKVLLENYFEPKFDFLFQQQLAILEKLESHNVKNAE